MIFQCDKCETVLAAGMRACPKCGSPFAEAVPAGVDTTERGFSPATPSAAPQKFAVATAPFEEPVFADDAAAIETPNFTVEEVIATARRRADELRRYADELSAQQRLQSFSAPSGNGSPETPSLNGTSKMPPIMLRSRGRWKMGRRERKLLRIAVGVGVLALFLAITKAAHLGYLPGAIFDRLISGGGAAQTDGSAGKSHVVTYRVTGSARTAQITYHSQQGTAQGIEETALPWSRRIVNDTDRILSVSALNKDASGTLTAEILVDGKLFKKSTSKAKGQGVDARGILQEGS